jgi:hypothetical protein
MQSFIKRLHELIGIVTDTCNLSYSGGTDWEDHGSRPAWAKVSETPHLNQKAGHGSEACTCIAMWEV